MQEDMLRALLRACEDYKENSTCNKRKIGAALVFPDGIAYFATNGSPIDHCTEKGKDYCTRKGDGFIEMPEYESCPSPCAEGSVVIMARLDGRKTKEGTLISTDFPCERCTNIIIDSDNVSGLYFGDYKKGNMRGRDLVYAMWMTENGITVNHLADDRLYVHSNEGIPYTFRKFSIRTPGGAYLRQMLDNGIKIYAKRTRILWAPENKLITIPIS